LRGGRQSRRFVQARCDLAVKRLTTSVENSSAIGASVQDATMHALFAALVQSNVRETSTSSAVFNQGTARRLLFRVHEQLRGAELAQVLSEMA
jgi:hypothetical protein